MNDWLATLVWRCWWRWPGADYSTFDLLYRSLNLIEGAFWLTLAGLVVRRSLRGAGAPVEAAYAGAFALFGVSDFVEAWALCSWLIGFKALNLAALLWLRRLVLRRYYPASRTY